MAELTQALFCPGEFSAEEHFYPRVVGTWQHPTVRYFMSLSNEAIAARYCHLNPGADPVAVRAVLAHRPSHFRWGGADLLVTATTAGVRRLVVIETNSCPSGQKSMPARVEGAEDAGYRALLARSFLPLLQRRALPRGGLAVLYDKNPMENGGYAAMLAELTGEPVHLVPFAEDDPDPPARFTEDRVLEIRTLDGDWIPIRAAFRYVTQRPWSRIPPLTRTAIFNPVLTCLAGGRNKLLAAKAYDLFNAELSPKGLTLRYPETIWDVGLSEVPLWVARFGGVAVVKNPYSNAGQGVYTITSEVELDAFLALDHPYDRFIVQALVGNLRWSSLSRGARSYHVGTVPDPRGRIFAADVRFMVAAGPAGFYPVAIYARQAPAPLTDDLDAVDDSWQMLGTNLSRRLPDGGWTTEPERLLPMDARGFNRMGLGLDDLIDGFLQATLAVTAIDRMACQLVNTKGGFRRRRFAALNPDPRLVEEICR